MPDPCLASSPRIALSVTGTPRSLSADIVQSPHQGNIAQNRGDGLYVPGLEWLTSNAFPSQPDDGMIVGMSPTNGMSWTFRFNAASTAQHQWEFIGGAAWIDTFEGAGSFQPSGAGNWVTLASNGGAGPSITVPIDGYWEIAFGAAVNAAVDGNAASVGLSIGGADPAGDFIANSANVHVASVARTLATSAPATTKLQLMYRDVANSSGPQTTFARRWLSVKPIRVA